jgi:hypothetical protein
MQLCCMVMQLPQAMNHHAALLYGYAIAAGYV